MSSKTGPTASHGNGAALTHNQPPLIRTVALPDGKDRELVRMRGEAEAEFEARVARVTKELDLASE